MKKCLIMSFIVAFLFFTGFQLFSADVELIVNPGFENGTEGWERRNCTFSQSSEYAHSGTYSGYATDRTSDWMGIKQSLLGKITNGATYQVSGWMRISAASDYIKMTVEQADANGTQYLGIAEGTGNNTGWTELSGTFTVNIEGTLSKFDLYFEGPAAGVNFWLDDVSFFGPGSSDEATASVDLGTVYQTMEGFGGAGGWIETSMSGHPQLSTLCDLLFKDMGLDIFRFRNTYEIETAYLDKITTIINAARAAKPDLKLKVAAWSPPARMKSNNNTREGTLAQSGGSYMYDEFAQWWADSLSDFESRGIRPDYVSIQNEPDYTNSGWDTCEWAPTETSSLAGFVEAFRAVYNLVGSGYTFVAPDGANFQGAGEYIDVFNSTDKANIYAYAYHLYGGLSDLRQFATTYTDKPHMMAEYSHHEDQNQSTFNDAMNLATTMDSVLANGEASAYIYWELYWTAPKGLISIDSSNYTINPVYYVFKQFSAFVHAGWERVGITSDSLNLNLEAYISPERDALSIIIINAGTGDMTLTISDLGGFDASSGTLYRTSESQNCQNIGSYTPGSSMTIPGRSVTTIALSGTGGTPGPTTVPTPTPTPTTVPTPTPTEVPLDCTDVPVWDADAIYDTAGTRVQYNGNLYENNWYTQGENPEENSGEYEVWTLLGSCGAVDPTDRGDVNEDGTIDIVDALLTAQYYVGLNPPDFSIDYADTNCDDSVDIVDALLIAQYYVGLISQFC